MDEAARLRIESITEKEWEEIFDQWTENRVFTEWEKELEKE